MTTKEQAAVKRDVRFVFYRGEAEVGECVRIHGNVIKSTLEKLGAELGGHIGHAVGCGAEAIVWHGVRYHWTIEVLTDARRRQLLLEVYRERAMARRAEN
jgi:hypothetical protein